MRQKRQKEISVDSLGITFDYQGNPIKIRTVNGNKLKKLRTNMSIIKHNFGK
jgi:hypothetical protein